MLGAALPIDVVETAPLVLNIALVLLLAATLGFIARRLGLPAIVGYLLTGLLVSPFTPGLVAGTEQLAVLADIGVVLLLFEVGIEINLPKLSREQRPILWGAPLQIIVGLAIATPIFLALDVPLFGALMLALGVAMSSSVVIVNITRSSRRTTNPATEQALLGWSVVQDIVGVAIATLVLTFFGSDDRSVGIAVLELLGFGALAILAAKLLPYLLRAVNADQDLFLIYSVATGLAISAIGAVAFNVPMALAAFVAGLAVHQGRETEQVRKVLLPFRDLFAVLFFVLIGTLIQPSKILDALPFAILLLILLLAVKTLPIYLISRFSNLGAKPLQLGIGLSQLGEFSFVLGSAALAANSLSQNQFTSILIAVTLSIALSSIFVRLVGREKSELPTY